jgi:hypothetical protein
MWENKLWCGVMYTFFRVNKLRVIRVCGVATSSMTTVNRACPSVAVNWIFHYILDEDLS